MCQTDRSLQPRLDELNEAFSEKNWLLAFPAESAYDAGNIPVAWLKHKPCFVTS